MSARQRGFQSRRQHLVGDTSLTSAITSKMGIKCHGIENSESIRGTIGTMTSIIAASSNAINETPQFEHDCDCCHFLGRHVDPETSQKMDLYAHTSGRSPTVIARTGIDGDYMSGLSFSYGGLAPLTEARKRAQAAGFLQYDLRTALAHATPEDATTYAELKEAIAASPEWKALLAFDANEKQKSQGIIIPLVDAAFEKEKEYNPSAMRLGSCFEVTQRIDKMLQVMRGYNQLQSMLISQSLTEFAWKDQRPPVTYNLSMPN
jgi:hypothetical protein